MFLVFVILYVSISMLPPFLFRAGYYQEANSIYSVYRFFCHQRVERSLFLFSKDSQSFYSLGELQQLGAIPDKNPNVPNVLAEKWFGYGYSGNILSGYKAALCIRDLALYSGVIIVGVLFLLHVRSTGTKFKPSPKLLLLLTLPLVLDVAFQIFAETFGLSWVSQAYIDSISKRVITGLMFGAGFGLWVFYNLKDLPETESSEVKGSHKSE